MPRQAHSLEDLAATLFPHLSVRGNLLYGVKGDTSLDRVTGVLEIGHLLDRRIGGLRDVDYDLRRLWASDLAVQTQREIWRYDCPQCWTPCEAYPTILGNLTRATFARATPAQPPVAASSTSNGN